MATVCATVPQGGQSIVRKDFRSLETLERVDEKEM